MIIAIITHIARSLVEQVVVRARRPDQTLVVARIRHEELVRAVVERRSQHLTVAHQIVLETKLRFLRAVGEEGLGEDVVSEVHLLSCVARHELVRDLRGLTTKVQRTDGVAVGVSERRGDAVVLE